MESLVCPVPRIVYDSVIKYSDIDLLIDTLLARKKARDAILSGRIPMAESQIEIHQALRNVSVRKTLGFVSYLCILLVI